MKTNWSERMLVGRVAKAFVCLNPAKCKPMSRLEVSLAGLYKPTRFFEPKTKLAVDKTALINVISHTDAHNRVLQERVSYAEI